jgi:CRP-like cAMP-binding protein
MPQYDQASPLALHLGQSITFTPAEAEALGSLERETVQVRDHTTLVQEGDPQHQGYIVKSGWLARHHSLSDGREQILDFVIPGDLPGLEGCVLDAADHSVTTLADATVAPFSFAKLQEIVSEHPRLATAMIWSGANDKAALGQRLTSLGRRTAYEAAAHLIFTMWQRLSLTPAVGGAGDRLRGAVSLRDERFAGGFGRSPIGRSPDG